MVKVKQEVKNWKYKMLCKHKWLPEGSIRFFTSSSEPETADPLLKPGTPVLKMEHKISSWWTHPEIQQLN